MLYWILRGILIFISKVFFRFKVEGLDNIPKKSNFIIVANHVSFLDPLAVMTAVPKKIHCIALRSLYKITWIKWFLYMVEALPSGRISKKAVHLLNKNNNIGLFPEGGVNREGNLGEFRRGSALLALKTGRPILPCAIFGTFESLPFGAKFPKLFTTIKVKIGKPIYILKEFD
ncbi:MAG TPA: lysophospholipid acyltransferase family protein, partial [Candidatus Margulisiibacteriota bacterium]|nr:lysophospholipid acyltransferase family protein [Candidatus Margulisiibacteriota bacterium]